MGQKKTPQATYIPSGGDSPRLAVPKALVSVLTTLIDGDYVPSSTRVELRSIRSRLCRVYRLDDPQAPARDTDVSQYLEESDGVPQDY